MHRVGVVGGSGLYEMGGLQVEDEVRLQTPFGDPSDAFVLGRIDGVAVAFLARHGRGHRYPPSEVPYRANVYGFKLLGVRHLLSVSAVGSLRQEIEPLHMVVPDQFVDLTRGRIGTFLDRGMAAHVSLADPVCARLSAALVEACRQEGVTVHAGGTYVCIEGPQFSTRAESRLYRSWGMDVIGMTNATEARLAREAEIAYATLAMACDYDCWHDEHEDVTAEMAFDNLRRSAGAAQRVVRTAVRGLSADEPSSCEGVLRRAVATDARRVDATTRLRLTALIDLPRNGDAE